MRALELESFNHCALVEPPLAGGSTKGSVSFSRIARRKSRTSTLQESQQTRAGIEIQADGTIEAVEI